MVRRKTLSLAATDHVSFGAVTGEDGKALKTRDGGTIKLKALLDEAENVPTPQSAEKKRPSYPKTNAALSPVSSASAPCNTPDSRKTAAAATTLFFLGKNAQPRRQHRTLSALCRRPASTRFSVKRCETGEARRRNALGNSVRDRAGRQLVKFADAVRLATRHPAPAFSQSLPLRISW